MRIPKPALLALLITAYVVWVLSLAVQLRAETVRYEYRALPEGESKPLLIPCFVLDRFNYLCIETGDIFVDVAGFAIGSLAARDTQSLTTDLAISPRRQISTATPSIILTHQKLASDAWVDRTRNKKGERCCDQGKDCFSLGPERIEHVPGGVNITLDDGRKVFVRGEDIMPSEDGHWWLCYWNNQIKCVFSPYSGS